MKLMETIAQERGSYTKTERRIADYLLDSPLELAFSSVGSVASRLSISKTSLIRFAKRLGFEGYQELRSQLQEEAVRRSSPAERFQSLADRRQGGGVAELAGLEMDNIQQCLDRLDEDMLSAMAEKMASARRVYTAGWSMAAFAAEIMSCRMSMLGFPFEYLSLERRGLAEGLMYARPGDLLILFDFPDYAPGLAGGAAFARAQGVEVALVTDYVTCPLVKYADLVFYCHAQTDLFKNSLTAPVFLVNVLMSQAIYRDNEKMLRYLKRREEVQRFEEAEYKRRDEP